jgi:hypothetical protein
LNEPGESFPRKRIFPHRNDGRRATAMVAAIWEETCSAGKAA